MALRLRSDQVSGLVLTALAAFALWQNRSYPVGSVQEPGPGYTPLIIGVFLGFIGLLIALKGVWSKPLAELRWPEAPRAATILVACAVAIYALQHLGYRITVAALLVFFLGVMERRKPLAVAAVAIGFSLISYYVVGTLLRVPLPLGPGGW